MSSSFDPWSALAGGALIGLAAALLWLGLGRIAGIAGILGRLTGPAWAQRSEAGWHVAFVVGLIVGPAIVMALGVQLPTTSAAPLPLVIGAGLLVGIGTTLGSGCTSGHGICGLARLAPRSLAAVIAFMATGAAVASVARVLAGS